MLTLLSPAKKLLNFKTPYLEATSLPLFRSKTAELVALMKTLSTDEIGRLMDLSHDLALLNYQRYQSFSAEGGDISVSYPALFLFQGDVYQSLKAQTWDNSTIKFSESHLAILSGLYGLLRPLDLIQSYRLEMGTRLANSCGKNLYDFWQATITNELNQRLSSHKNPLIINLASGEYFNVVNKPGLNVPVLTIHFKEQKNNELKVIGIHAKKARGAMANYIMQHQIDDIEAIKQFNLLSYSYCENSSTESDFNFIR